MTSETVDLALKPGEMSVCIGMPVARDVPWPTAISLTRTAHACALRGIPFDVVSVVGSSVITTARSTVAHRFLQKEASRIFWIDSDMEWSASDFLRLLALSSRMDVVCATYPLKRDEDRVSFVVRHADAKTFEMNSLGCLKIDGAGLGFTVMTRKVVETVAATKRQVLNEPTGEQMAEMFRIDVAENGAIRGEDIAFFDDIRAAGFDIWLDPTVELGHVGQKIYRADVVKGLRLGHVYARS